MEDDIQDEGYAVLARFRLELRRFLQFSEKAALEKGWTAQQYQALLALRAAPDRTLRVGQLAEELLLKPHSATGLVDRLAALGQIVRVTSEEDRRQVCVKLTSEAEAILRSLAAVHRAELRRLRPMLTALIAEL